MNKRAMLLLLAAAATPAAGQFGGRRRGGMGGADRGDKSGEKGDKSGEAGEPRVNTFELTAHELHEDLKLTPLQEPLWQSYLDKVRALANDIVRERTQLPSGRSVTQKIDRVVDVARNHLTALEDIAQAAKELYAKLTPEQQPAADPRLANLMAMPLAQPGGGPGGPGRRAT